MRALAALLWLALAGIAGAAPDPGLMFNRTGLPLVFPLQVKTDPGRDVAMVLRDADTGEAAVAAYIVGGEFFRVLVPPGTFTLEFAAGTEWEGMETLFGPETERFTFPEPLTFEVKGMARKSGHLIDLREDGRMVQRSIDLCQRFAYAPGEPQGPDAVLPRQPDDDWDPGDYSAYDDEDERFFSYRDPRRQALLERRNLHLFPSPGSGPEPTAPPRAPGDLPERELVERFCD